MVRLAWTLNVVLAAGLVWAVLGRERTDAERLAWVEGDAEYIPGGGIRVLEMDSDWRRSWVVDFGVAMAGAEPDTPAPEGVVRLAPPAPVQCRWRSPMQLEVHPWPALRRATAYTVLPDPALRAADGRRLPEGLRIGFATRRLQLLSVVPVEDEAEPGRTDLALAFDLPVDALELAAALSIRRADGAPLAFTLDERPGAEEPAWRARFADPAALAGQEAVEVTIAGTLTPAGGTLPLGAPVVRAVPLRESLETTGVSAGPEGIDVEFNHGIPLPGRELVAVEPAVPFRVLRSWRGLRIAGAFPPGDAVTVVLREGFPGRGAARLAAETRRPVRIPDRRPALAFPDPGQVLSALAHPEVVVEAVNVDRVRATVRTLYANNAVHFARAAAAAEDDGRIALPDAVFGPPKRQELPAAAPRNAASTLRIDLRELLGGEARGVHEVTVEDLAGRARPAVRMVQVTDLAVTCRLTPDAAAVHVTSLARATPVAGATVRLLSPTNQPLAAGETGGEGVAVLRHPRGEDDRVPYLVEVRAGDDRTLIDREGFRVALTEDVFGGRPHLVEGVEAYVAPDRGVARPGETLRATAVVRTASGAAPAGASLDVRWLDPRGRAAETARVDVPSSGLVALAHATGPGAPAGAWTLELRDAASGAVAGSAAFRLEAFVPDRIRADARLDGPVLLDRTVRVEVAAAWLDGSPAAGLPVAIHPRFDLGRFSPPEFEGWSFGGATDPEVPPGAQPPVRAALDDRGRASVEVRIPAAPPEAQSLRAAFRVEVEDPSGRVVRAAVEAEASRPDFHLGLRPLPAAAEIAVVDAAGRAAAPPGPVVVELERRRHRWWWTWRRRDRVGTESRFEREILQVRTAAMVDGRGRVDFDAVEPVPGTWLAAVARCGPVVAEADLGRGLGRPERLEVRGPDGPVVPGGTAVLAVESPIAGRAFVTLEGATLHSWKVASVALGRTEIPVEIPAGLALPNVHALITVTAPQARKDAAGPAWIAGGTAIRIAHPARRVDPRLDAPAKVLPESALTVRVVAPGATRATVAAVDEGVHRHAGDAEPDPVSWFLAPRRLDSEGADTGTSLAAAPRFDPGVLVGGGDGGDDDGGSDRLAGTTSVEIRPLALFAEIALDAEGRGEAELRLPPYEGRIRIAAIAAGPAATGAATAWTVVAAPIGLQVAGPRMLAPGDSCDLVVSLRNHEETEREIDVACAARGGLVLREPAPGRRFRLGPGAGADFAVAVEAGGDGGVQELVCTASAGDDSRVTTLAIPVRAAAPFAVERLGVVAAAGTTSIAVPGRWRGGAAAARLLVDRGPDLALLPVLDALLEYPHGCIEQTASILRGVLATRVLLPRFHPDGGAPDADAIVATGVSRILAMQAPDGGLAYWPGGRTGLLHATLLGADLLLEANASGVRVPEEPLRRIVDRLAALSAGADDVSTACAAAEVLSRAAYPIGAEVGRLAGVARLPGDRARVALALHRAGRGEEASRVLDGGAGPSPETPREEGGLHRSALQASALELLARLEISPASPRIPELAAALGEAALRPALLTTQEQGRILAALARFHAVRAREAVTTTAELIAGDRRIRLDAGRAASFEVQDGATIAIESDGPLHAVLEVRGFRADAPAADGLGLGLEQLVVDLDTGAPAEGFRRGRVYEVRVAGRTEEPVENLLLSGVVPGGFEIESPELWARDGDREPLRGALEPDRVEARDDRVLLFRTAPLGGRIEARWRIRAVFPGTFAAGSVQVEALYRPGAVSRLAPGGKVTIR